MYLQDSSTTSSISRNFSGRDDDELSIKITLGLTADGHLPITAEEFEKVFTPTDYYTRHIARLRDKRLFSARRKAIIDQINIHFEYGKLDLVSWVGTSDAYNKNEKIQSVDRSEAMLLFLESPSGQRVVDKIGKYLSQTSIRKISFLTTQSVVPMIIWNYGGRHCDATDEFDIDLPALELKDHFEEMADFILNEVFSTRDLVHKGGIFSDYVFKSTKALWNGLRFERSSGREAFIGDCDRYNAEDLFKALKATENQ